MVVTSLTFVCSCGNHEPKEDPTRKPGNETATLAIYAIWESKKDLTTYDGLYDSASRYIKLCKSSEEVHVDDPSEIRLQSGDNCYKQGENFAMIIIKRDSVAHPLFLTVLHVDSTTKNFVGVTDSNDTIATSIKTMSARNFDELKREYKKPVLRPGEIDKIKKYYSPEKKEQNQLKKDRALRRLPQ